MCIKRKLFCCCMCHAFVSKDCYVGMGEFETLDIDLLLVFESLAARSAEFVFYFYFLLIYMYI